MTTTIDRAAGEGAEVAVLPPARQKTGAGRIGFAGLVLAVLLVAAGLVLLHDALTAGGIGGGDAWISAAVRGLDGLSAQWWMIPAGVGIALVGVWLIVTALRPRSRRAVPLTSATGIFLHTRDIARLASDAAAGVDGVLSASSVAGRRTVTVTVLAATDQVKDAVTAAVIARLTALSRTPTVTVRVRPHLPGGN